MGVVRAAIQWAADGGEIPTMPAVYKVQATMAKASGLSHSMSFGPCSKDADTSTNVALCC
jgi:hypothetical protein